MTTIIESNTRGSGDVSLVGPKKICTVCTVLCGPGCILMMMRDEPCCQGGPKGPACGSCPLS